MQRFYDRKEEEKPASGETATAAPRKEAAAGRKAPAAPAAQRPSGSEGGRRAPVRKKQTSGVLREILYFLIKILSIAVVTVLLFTFVFGILRNVDSSMSPAVRDGDLVLFYRLDRDVVVSDTVVVQFEGIKQVRRIIAMEGDEVDIRSDGLYINGFRQVEARIYEATERYDTGVEFPLVVPEGEIFVLADSRNNATDSRVYGTVKLDDILGKVFTIVRKRGI